MQNNMKFNEQYTVENHIIRFLTQQLGYEYIKPEEFGGLREFESEFLIKSHSLEAIRRINAVGDDEATNVLREVKKIDSNEGFLELYRHGVNLKDPKTGKSRYYRVIDSEDIDNNHFVVTNQFYFEGNLENIRPDIMIFVNGFPLIDIEAKSPTANELTDYSKAVGQIKRYERNAGKLFWPNCFNIATDGMETAYGATYSPAQYFLHWKDEDLEKKVGGNLEMTLFSLLNKENLLDIINNFIVFEKSDEGKVKKICRYQQFRATNKIVDRVKKKEKKLGLVWHTQGSGKSLTMFFTAWKLRFDKELNNPKIFVLVDRIDLDDQIYGTFINCGGENVERVMSRKDLEQKITNDERGIFISTIQKFSELPASLSNPNENIIVLSDEAHRDNEGISAINLRASMRNAFFFGFTGTPIDKLTLNTHRNFGEEGERYLDYYSIQQAIDDEATLPVTYEARLSKFFIDEEKLDQQFDQLTIDLNDDQRSILMKKYGKKEGLIKLPKRMRAVAQDILEHYRLYVEPNGFKAQVVCFDREATAMYKQIFDELLPQDFSEVIYSSGDPNIETENLRKYNTEKREREQIVARFKDPKSPLKFLLVCDMLLTGFDAPIEQAMYLDKPLRDHNLLQAIARTNRVYPNKGCGKIIDYYGITKNLYEALNFDESVVSSAMIDIEKFKQEFVEILDEISELFVGINIEDPSMANLRKCLRIFADNENKQNFFTEKFSRLKLLFEILSPDPFLKPFLRKFEWLMSFGIGFNREFSLVATDHELLAEYGEKVRNLIKQKIDYEGITKNFRELKVNELYILENMSKEEDEDKAIALEKIIRGEITLNAEINPAFQKFSERLAAIKKEFEQKQIDLAERIRQYHELLNEIQNKSGEAARLGLDMREYGLYLIASEYVESPSQSDMIGLSHDISARLTGLLDKNWQESSKREEFIKSVKQIIQGVVLKDYRDKIKIKDFPRFLNRLVDVIVKRF